MWAPRCLPGDPAPTSSHSWEMPVLQTAGPRSLHPFCLTHGACRGVSEPLGWAC